MIDSKDIMEIYPVESIIKKYPQSGQKQVLLIQHKNYGKVILKVVEGRSERVEREINIVTNNNFTSVPRILNTEKFIINGIEGLFICEEFIDGLTLREILNKEKQLPLNEVVTLAESLLSIIVELENHSIVHRDIKPENIIRDNDGNWFLIDFGIARDLKSCSLTMTNAQVGPHTPGYAAPELFQYNKKDIDSRADIFSLGIVLFEALVGSHPFLRGDELDLNEIWYSTVTIEPKYIQIDGDIDMQFMGLIQTFMQKHISRRPICAAKAMEWFQNVKKTFVEEDS